MTDWFENWAVSHHRQMSETVLRTFKRVPSMAHPPLVASFDATPLAILNRFMVVLVTAASAIDEPQALATSAIKVPSNQIRLAGTRLGQL